MNTYEFHLSLLQKKKKGKKALPKNLLYPEKTRYEEYPYTEDEWKFFFFVQVIFFDKISFSYRVEQLSRVKLEKLVILFSLRFNNRLFIGILRDFLVAVNAMDI